MSDESWNEARNETWKTARTEWLSTTPPFSPEFPYGTAIPQATFRIPALPKRMDDEVWDRGESALIEELEDQPASMFDLAELELRFERRGRQETAEARAEVERVKQDVQSLTNLTTRRAEAHESAGEWFVGDDIRVRRGDKCSLGRDMAAMASLSTFALLVSLLALAFVLFS